MCCSLQSYNTALDNLWNGMNKIAMFLLSVMSIVFSTNTPLLEITLAITTSKDEDPDCKGNLNPTRVFH